MEVDMLQFVLINAPNYLGLLILGYQQSVIIKRLLNMLDDEEN